MIISDKEAEKVDFVICCSDLTHNLFLDNLEGNCIKCKKQIYFRPHIPKKPKKICMECAEKLDVAKFVITEKVAQELRNLTKN